MNNEMLKIKLRRVIRRHHTPFELQFGRKPINRLILYYQILNCIHEKK